MPGPVTIALVGRPNVGKSSLLNALLGEERMIVSEIPGTTRDAIDTRMAFGQGEIVLDRHRRASAAAARSPPARDADRYSTLRALKAVDRADVVVLVVDAVDGLTAQDAHVAGYAVDAGKGLVLAVNKWDLVADKTDRTFDQYVTWIQRDAPFLDFAPVVSISAKTGQRVERVLELAVDVWGERRKRIGTGELNRLLTDAVARQAPPAVKNRRPRLYYATQAGDRAADLRLLRERCRSRPLLLPALPREPDPRRAGLRRDPDQAGLPRSGHRAAAAHASGCAGAGERPAGRASPELTIGDVDHETSASCERAGASAPVSARASGILSGSGRGAAW